MFNIPHDIKLILGVIAAIMSIIGHLPYIISILKGNTKPHLFTWVIWIVMTAIAFAAQIVGGAGPGAWTTGINVVLAVVIAILALKHGEKNITHSDWIMFISGVLAIPLWMVTKDPLWSVILVTVIDALAFGPTIRKSWYKPYEELSFMYGFNIFRHFITLTALAQFSFVTALYPAMLFVMNIVSYAVIKGRRTIIAS